MEGKCADSMRMRCYAFILMLGVSCKLTDSQLVVETYSQLVKSL